MVPGVDLDVLAMSDTKQLQRRETTYAGDFYGWTQEQARLLRSTRPNTLDWANLAEEIEELGGSEQSEIENRLCVLLVHLLKWQVQSGRRKGGWKGTIVEQRARLARRLRRSPSLVRYPAEVLSAEYRIARIKAVDEIGFPVKTFPNRCPFTIEQVLDEAFWPGDRD
jgi:hypothetical protein